MYRDSVNSGEGPCTTARDLQQVQNVKRQLSNNRSALRDEIEELIRIEQSVRVSLSYRSVKRIGITYRDRFTLRITKYLILITLFPVRR